MNLSITKEKLNKLPKEPGVYIFREKSGKILYIGKATSLKSRVHSYFRGADGRGAWIANMVDQIMDFDFVKTDSVLEALILESNLIKKHQPKYNTDLKDDKSFSYFAITKEEFPRIIICRATEIDFKGLRAVNSELKTIYGPYTSKKQMEVALKIIRRIFPFHSNKQQTEKGCLDFQLGLCPGPYAGAISKMDYKKNIQGIEMILKGKKKNLVTALEKEMKIMAKKHEFEKAAELRNKIFALKHIHDVALMSNDFEMKIQDKKYKMSVSPAGRQNTRIEAYDISNISGTNAVGSMVVFEKGEPSKKEYRKFKIKTVAGIDDVGMMREVLLRRFQNDWPMPDLILLDGGQGHLNMGEKLLHKELGLAVDIVAVAKGPARKNVDLRLSIAELKNDKTKKIFEDKNLVKQIMDEAHRFAISYHRKLRKKSFI